MEEEIQDYIEQYFSDALSAEDSEAFEERRANDPVFAEQVEMYLQNKAAIAKMARGALRSEAASMYEEEKGKRRTLTIRRISAVAAVALVLIAAAIWVLNPAQLSSDQLYAQYFEAPIPSGTRSADDVAGEEWNAGVDNYRSGNYSDAAVLFESIKPTGSEASLLAGVAFMEAGQYSEAERNLNQIQSQSSFYPDARWYTALLYIRMERPADARSILQAFVETGGFKKSEAEELLKQLP